MKKYEGDLRISKDTEVDFDEITGKLIVEKGVKFIAKELKKVGGYLSLNATASLDAPKLETVGGYLSLNATASLDAPKLETVGGDLYLNATASLPKLETVGGDLSLNATASLDAPKLKNKNDPTAKATCSTALAVSFKKKGLIKIDGILSWFISKKKAAQLVVFKVNIVGKLSVSFVVQRGEQFSHGNTIKQATESLRYKLSDRHTTRFKKWTLKTKVKVDDAIQAYRAITGACETGTQNFCESIKMPKTVTVAEIITLTKGKYENEKFAAFFQ